MDNTMLSQNQSDNQEELYPDFGWETAEAVPKQLDEYVHYFHYSRPAAALAYKSPVQYKTELGFCQYGFT